MSTSGSDGEQDYDDSSEEWRENHDLKPYALEYEDKSSGRDE